MLYISMVAGVGLEPTTFGLRVTEVNNSYFQIQEINYNQEEIKSQIQQLDLKIRNTDFEISKLNSIEFDIDL